MRKYRTETSIILEALQGIADGEVTTASLSRHVNVPYTRMVDLVDEICRRELIEPVVVDVPTEPRPTTYRLTKQGVAFIEEAMRFQRILGIYGLRL
jgi:predicted transcriptional regulator